MASEHDPVHEQAEAYVLGALSAAERAAFETHLASCAACAADVRALLPVASALALSAPQTDPPPALRARVVASITRTGGDRGVHAAAPMSAWLALAASLALAAGIGAYAVRLRTRVSTAESTLAVLAAPDVKRVDLAGQPAAPSASARAYWSRSRGLVFTASNLPPLPAGRVYQLWVLTAQPAPISAGLIKPDTGGSANAVFDTPVDLPAPVAMAVTIEPDGGVTAPTGDKYLVGLAH